MKPVRRSRASRFVKPLMVFTWHFCHFRSSRSTHWIVAEDCSATLVEIANELSDLPFGQLIAFSVFPLASLHSGSLGGTVLIRGTNW
uniref:Uncharacterized protein n=1 Tax=Solanum tuberosum TaxID=4113 RepID=M1DJE5_SOLTU